MKKIYFIFLLIAFNASAQTNLPYFTGWESTQQTQGWQQIRKGATFQDWNINQGAPFMGTKKLYHGYPVGGSTATDDWYVSPAFTIYANGKIDSLRYRYDGFGTPGIADTVALYILKGNADPDLASSKTLLIDFKDPSFTKSVYTLKENVSISDTGKIYVAFRYKTIINWLDVSIDNLSINGQQWPTAISGVDEVKHKVYPNPVSDRLYIPKAYSLCYILDIYGRMVHRQEGEADYIEVSNLPSGQYSLQMISKENKKSHCLFIEE